MKYSIPTLPLELDLETKEVLKQVNRANRSLAELKGVASSMPNEQILINTLTLQEAKESSEIENIVTTQDDLYSADMDMLLTTASAKEVLKYREAILYGFDEIRAGGILNNRVIKQIQECLVGNKAGFRSVPGTVLKDSQGRIVYTPPQSGEEIVRHMRNLESYINSADVDEYDPLIKMAIIHHQFESIHPFYDGNGRTGRIINVLYLVVQGLLDLPILYLSRYITANKAEYYRLIQNVRDQGAEHNQQEWEAWVLFILKGVEHTADEMTHLVKGIVQLMNEYKQKLRPIFGKQYRHELLNNLFFHPYTKIEFMEQAMMVQRKTATKYLDMIVEAGLLTKVKKGRMNYYVNEALVELLVNRTYMEGES